MIGMASLFGCMVIGMSVVGLQASETYKAQRVRKQAQAFALAESGIECAQRWLTTQASPPSGTATITPLDSSVELGAGSFNFSVIPDAANPNQQLKTYTLQSIGTVNGISQSINVTMRSQSFGRFAYFSDQESANPLSQQIWFGRRDKIRGPFFTNNSNSSFTNIDNSNPDKPIFDSSVEMNGASINYMSAKPVTDADFLKVFTIGRSAVKLAVNRIELPTTTTNQANAAWGSTAGHPTTTGVCVRTAGGIYVTGDASVELQAPSAHVQVLKITQGSKTTVVQIDLQNKLRNVTDESGTTNHAGLGTGVVFVTGNITSIKGKMADSIVGANPVKSAMTIVADAAAGRTMTVTGSIEYRTTNNTAIAPDTGVNLVAGILGLYANKIRIGASAGANVRVDGIIMAGTQNRTDGGFGADAYESRSVGTLTLNGGLIQKVRAPVGTFSGSSMVSGFTKDYYYDERMMDTPPPYFPTTGKYDLLSWKQI